MKKSNRNIMIFLAGVFAGMVLFQTLRIVKNEEKDQPTNTEVCAENLLEDIDAKAIESIDQLPESILMANREFSLNLFKKLAIEKNAVYSPVPVYLSLGLVSNGAEGQANQEILETLNLTNLATDEINRYSHELVDLLEADGEATLGISNSIWFDQHFKADVDFLQTNKTYYDADTFKIDFTVKNTATVMNDWVSQATNEKIKKMVNEIGEDTVMYLFSTIYFDGKWEMPFAKEDTSESEFLVDGEILDVEKMTGRFEIEHLITDEEEGIILPYEGGQYSFLALMPSREVTIREYLEKMTSEQLGELIQSVSTDEVEILLPKFKMSFESTLNKTLIEMGINQVFDLESNSLSKMGEATGNLYISKMLQKTFIEVNELGTEAASAVSSEIDMMSLPEPKPTIDFNRPFIYSIMNDETGLPIFLGIMDQPEK